MFGAIPLSLYIDLQRKQGVGYQMPLKLHIPSFTISDEFLVSVTVSFKHNDGGATEECSSGSMTSIDHPSFSSLRRHLDKNGYIKKEDLYTNGDIVLKEFLLNGVLFSPDDSFPCAAAMRLHLKYQGGSDAL